MGRKINACVFLSMSVTWPFGPLGKTLGDQVGHESVCILTSNMTHIVYAFAFSPVAVIVSLNSHLGVIITFAIGLGLLIFLVPQIQLSNLLFLPKRLTQKVHGACFNTTALDVCALVACLAIQNPCFSTIFRIITIIVVP